MSHRPVLIAVPTYRRTSLLPRLVSVIRQDAATTELQSRIVLFDNDPVGSAGPVADQLAVGYVPVPTPGIAAVRQAALDHAQGTDLLVMVDDDLLPEPGWLQGLVDAWRKTAATAVMGYVRYVWPSGTDPWVEAGQFMRRTRFPTGTPLPFFATGNVLIDVTSARTLGVSFDLAYGLSGGEDTRFGEAVLRAGGTIVAAGASICRDDIPEERTSRDWVRRRTICHGELRTLLALAGSRGPIRALRSGRCLLGGAIRWMVFTALHMWGRIRGDLSKDAVGKRRSWFAIGRIRGALGLHQPEYARPSTRGNVLATQVGSKPVRARVDSRIGRSSTDR